ncbi:hypothetical protein ACJIZ3_014393 [Penstemon smallii]|uniref:Uncharacterized protein n=1 Tax=Penstemon smallii TaxID=265156 RepID=A0ABD3RJF6_9LAMI
MIWFKLKNGMLFNFTTRRRRRSSFFLRIHNNN